MNNQCKILLVAIATTQVTACASLELMAVGGLSYLITGKGISDHALSMTTGKDCAFHRILTDGSLCADSADSINDEQEILLASNTEEQPSAFAYLFPEETQPSEATNEASLPESATSLPEDVTALIADNSNSETNQSFVTDFDRESINVRIDTDLPSENTIQPQVYAVVGSFNDLKYAFERSSLYRIYNTQIIETPGGSDTRYRVVVGPLDDRDLVSHIPNKTSIDTQPPWAIDLCADTLLPPPCNTDLYVHNQDLTKAN